MNAYVTGEIIKKLRESKELTQAQLAEKLKVSDKTVSKWETGRGCPDIALLEPLAEELGVSVPELMTGESISNTNRSFKISRGRFYVCPLCGNVLWAAGEAVIHCCGIALPPLEAEAPDPDHTLRIERVEDEYFVSLSHGMSKEHFISFLAAVRDEGVEIVKLYPEGSAEARFKIPRTRFLYAFCNRHGLFKLKLQKPLP